MTTKMEEIVTSDLSKFGSRERLETEKLLKAWREQGLPKDFYGDGVTVAMNTNSGYVFLTNSDYQVAMLTDDDKLESFYCCLQCGAEGFFDDVKNLDNHTSDDIQECRSWIKDIKQNRK